MELISKDLKDLTNAKLLLENPGLAARIANIIANPVEKGFALQPKNWKRKIGNITRNALLSASKAALRTMDDTPGISSSNGIHKFAVALSGGVGGLFGFTALAIELPLSTTIMLRSISDIARSEGESLGNTETSLACIEVLAMGGLSVKDAGTETGYFAVRSALAGSATKAASFIAEHGLVQEGAPAITRFVTMVAERFSIQVTEKASVQIAPGIGAAGGAIINTLFINHFQDMARGHFIIRRLEREYGAEFIQSNYESIQI